MGFNAATTHPTQQFGSPLGKNANLLDNWIFNFALENEE
jgi:hypothetical protein